VDTRPIGSTGLSCPVIGFGGIPIIHDVSEEEAVATVRHCLALGYRLFDTSRTYGDSERRIGLGLSGHAQDVILATKLGPWKVESERDAEGFIRESLDALGVTRVDILMIKNLDNENNLRRGLDLALPAVKRAQQAGLVGHIGMTSHMPAFAEAAIRTGEFAVAMLPYSIASRSHEPVIDLCHQRGIGVLAMKPLAGGALAESGERELPSVWEALSFCLDRPGVSAAIVGLNSPHQAEVAWRAGEMITALTAEDRDRLIAQVETLGEDYCRACGYCQPCTAGMSIDVILPLADRMRRFQDDDALRDMCRAQYRTMNPTAEACVNCEECLARCPFNLNIPERLREAHELLGG
jgi:predicted aldo/keto reductase-like oxidoreductase